MTEPIPRANVRVYRVDQGDDLLLGWPAVLVVLGGPR